MCKVAFVGWLVLLGSAACAAVESSGASRAKPEVPVARSSAPSKPSSPVESPKSQPSNTPSTLAVAGAVSSASEEKPRHTNDALDLWNDAAFRQRLVESYAAESDLEPRTTVLEREQLQQVFQLIGEQKTVEALALLDTLRSDIASAVFDFTAGNLHFEAEQLDAAVLAYSRAVEKHPNYRKAWRNLGMTRVRQGDYANAGRPLVRVIELGGGDALTYGLLGVSHASLDHQLSAESAFRMAILLDPGTLDWSVGLARCLFKQERFTDVVALTNDLLEAHTDRADFWLMQAHAFVGLEKWQSAAENFELIDGLGAASAENLFFLGDLYVNQELFDLAVNAYVRAIEKDENGKPERAVRAAKLLTQRGARSESKVLIERIEGQFGESLAAAERKELLRMRARLALAENATEEEARLLEEIVELDPLDGDALILLGDHSARIGSPERAVFYYERAAGIEASEADAKLGHAQLLAGLGRYAEALPLLRRAQALKPRDNVQDYLQRIEQRAAQSR